MLGLAEDYDAFDTDVIVDINSVMLNLKQIGVGPENGFSITGADEKWVDLIGADRISLTAVQQYIYLKVRLIFDPPTTSSHIDAMKEVIKELEWRLCLEADG